jgi:PhzF family phenazine biosynthesis protein
MALCSIVAVFERPEMGLSGNTAAVIQLEHSLENVEMQRIASNLNQPATAFLWPADNPGSRHVRWFAPDAEIDLCGHGTLAATAILKTKVVLYSKNHTLSGKVLGDNYAEMQLQAIPVIDKEEIPEGLEKALGVPILSYYRTSNKDIVLLEREEDVHGMQPDFHSLRQIDVFGYAVTAAGKSCDFVSRTLVPHVRQLEDHATGSSHAALTPFWGNILKKDSLTAIQLSQRGGFFNCHLSGNQVTLAGHYSVLLTGKYDLSITLK